MKSLMTKQTLFLHHLPPELLLQIFSLLPYADLKLRLPLVCKLFSSLLAKPHEESATPIDLILHRDAPKFYYTSSACVLHERLPQILWPYTTSPLDASIPIYTTVPTAPRHFRPVKHTKRLFRHPVTTTLTLLRRQKTERVQTYKPLHGVPLSHENVSTPSASLAVYRLKMPSDKEERSVVIHGTGVCGAVTIYDLIAGVSGMVSSVRSKGEADYLTRCRWDGIESGVITRGEEGRAVLELRDVWHGSGYR